MPAAGPAHWGQCGSEMLLFHLSADTLLLKSKSLNRAKGSRLSRQKTHPLLCSGSTRGMGFSPALARHAISGAHGFHRQVCNSLVGSKKSHLVFSHMDFILVFIHRWLEKVTNQYFSAAGSESDGCGKSKAQGAHGHRKDC